MKIAPEYYGKPVLFSCTCGSIQETYDVINRYLTTSKDRVKIEFFYNKNYISKSIHGDGWCGRVIKL